MDVETHGLRELVETLSKAESKSVSAVAGVVTKGNINIKRDWRQRWSGIAHAPALPAAITDDVSFGFFKVRGEVGPDKQRRQGALGNLIEFGSENNAPIPGGLPALDAEAPRFESALADLGAGMLEA